MDLGATRVEVFVDGRVTVGGEPIAPPDGMDPYSAAIAVLAEYARSSGSPALAHAVDHTNGQEGRFRVLADGTAEPVAEAVLPAAREDFPRTEQPAPRPDMDTAPGAAGEPSPYGARHIETQFVRPDRPRPTSGVRGVLYSATGGFVNLGPSAKDQDEAELERRIARPLSGSFNTAVLSLKGGIGKTSTTVGVGMILAEYRGDHPCAIDANPDSGDLAERALGEMLYQKVKPRTVTDIVRDIDAISSLTALTDYMHHANRLHLVAGEQDPALSDALTADEYLKIKKLVSQYYSVTLTDCGTGVSHPAMAGVLPEATNLVIASGYAVSGAKRARNTLQWLAEHGYENLARNAIVVVTDKDQVSNRVNKRAIEEHLAGYCRRLITVPHDRGVADGDRISLDKISAGTRRSYKEIAAAIVDGYV
ncbi:ESX-1 secretion-associated protein EspI [Arthrobacter sp. Bi83]|jgi:MinD-like ATPase involved in chromosome partitioning or flagellar assembly|uniref:MinD/ParA family ATP-binding protein n=1 Tax=Arthrobacter sp. Bi83 TaxID=2822353 RepID=UPI001D4135A9|nr:MinD/ParA family protein [Arthrobacter sp. Bi83]CAH0190623.1 ESX-1 secretion-associated protein EspI [Arthrobacter sp. Bi83]